MTTSKKNTNCSGNKQSTTSNGRCINNSRVRSQINAKRFRTYKKQKKQLQKKQVKFTKDTKTHDGLTPIHQGFENLITSYWKNGYLKFDENILNNLYNLLNNVIIRSRKTPTKGVPILPKGGGEAIKVKWDIHKTELRKIKTQLEIIRNNYK